MPRNSIFAARRTGSSVRARATVGPGKKILASLSLGCGKKGSKRVPPARKYLPLYGHKVGSSPPDGDCLFNAIAQAYHRAPLEIRLQLTYNIFSHFDPGFVKGSAVLEVTASTLRTVVAKSVLCADPTRDEIIRNMHLHSVMNRERMREGVEALVTFADGTTEDADFALDETADLWSHMRGCEGWSETILDEEYRAHLSRRMSSRHIYWGDTFAWHVLETYLGVRLLVVEKGGEKVVNSEGSVVSKRVHRVHMGVDHGESFVPTHFVTLNKVHNHYMPIWFGKEAVFSFEDIPPCLVDICGRDFGSCRWYISLQVPPPSDSEDEEGTVEEEDSDTEGWEGGPPGVTPMRRR